MLPGVLCLCVIDLLCVRHCVCCVCVSLCLCICVCTIHIDVVLFLMVHVQPFNESLHVGKVRHVACCHYQYMKVKIMAIGTFRGGRAYSP